MAGKKLSPEKNAERVRKMTATLRAKWVWVACIHCGAVFEVQPHDALLRKYCSKACAGAHNPGARTNASRVFRADRVCVWCSKPFTVVHSRSRKQRFCSTGCRGEWQSSLPYDEWRGKLSENTARRPRGPNNYFYGKHPHGTSCEYVAADGRCVHLRSNWELAIASYLDAAGIMWVYEPYRFQLADRTYCPDFWLPLLHAFWEVKGWMHERHAETIRQFRELIPEMPLVVIGHGTIRGLAAAAGVKVRL